MTARFQSERRHENKPDGMESRMEYRGELLAPAGNMECLKAAIAAGADAVYLGGGQFGARAYAGNFSDEELIGALQLAHAWEKKIYLTVNTLTKQEELGRLTDWMQPFYEAGLDGVIVQDMGVLDTVRRAFPGMELHASTQMTVTESRSALFLKSLGVCRVVPARELSLEEIRILKEQTGMALEVFIHGALCYCYSGQCLFSSYLGGRSGNRGRCAQPCRQPYTILEEKGGAYQDASKRMKQPAYPLSLKDLCVLPFLQELMDARIDSFKIEGRMKRPEYVAGVTAVYRKYMDLYRSGVRNWEIDPADMELLSKLYVRSETGGGYYKQHNGREMVTFEKPGYSGCPEELLERIRREYLEKELTLPVSMCAFLEEGKPARLQVSSGSVSAEALGAEALPAQKRPLAKSDVEKQLKKTGGSAFYAKELQIEMGENLFLPVSALNELRRDALDRLWEKLCQKGKRTLSERTGQNACPDSGCKSDASSGQRKEPFLYASALLAEQALALLDEAGVRRLYVNADLLFAKEEERLMEKAAKRQEADEGFELFLQLPALLRSYSEPYLAALAQKVRRYDGIIRGFLAGSVTGMCWAREEFPEKKLSLQHNVYVFNRETLSCWENCFSIDTYTAPLELNRQELLTLPAQKQEMVVYGRTPMMISAGCVKRSAGSCRVDHTQKQLAEGIPSAGFAERLKDRYNAEFPVWVNCRHCMNTIYNSVPLSLHQYMEQIRGRGLRAVRLDFTDESGKKAAYLARFFAGEDGNAPDCYTTGHYKKGVQ